MRQNPAELVARTLSFLGVLVLAAAMNSCAGYQLGTTLPPGVKRVHVPTFLNKCGEPQAEIAATRATIEDLQKDGTLRVVAEADADVILTVTLVEHILEPLRFEKDRSKTTAEYRQLLKADIVLKRKGTGAIMVARQVQGKSTFIPTGDLGSSKRKALPRTARDLAHNIVESVVEFW